jgi:outer membrane lipoprotein SlyB
MKNVNCFKYLIAIMLFILAMVALALNGCKTKEKVVKETSTDSTRYILKTETKTDTVWRKIEVKIPVDCDKVDTVYLSNGGIKAKIITGNGKSTTIIDGKIPSARVTQTITETNFSAKAKTIVLKPDVIIIKPPNWLWILLIVSLCANVLGAYFYIKK